MCPTTDLGKRKLSLLAQQGGKACKASSQQEPSACCWACRENSRTRPGGARLLSSDPPYPPHPHPVLITGAGQLPSRSYTNIRIYFSFSFLIPRGNREPAHNARVIADSSADDPGRMNHRPAFLAEAGLVLANVLR